MEMEITLYYLYQYRTILMLSDFLIMLFPVFMLNRIVAFRAKYRYRIPLYLSCYALVSMPIYIGDPMNLPPVYLVVLAAVSLCADPSVSFLQKLTASTMVTGAGFSVNVLADNYFMIYNTNLWIHLLLKFGFWILLTLLVIQLFPKGGYSMNSGLWGTVLLLTLTPFGILAGVVVLLKYNSHIYENDAFFLWILVLCMISWAGLFLAVSIFAKNQEMVQQEHFYQMRQQYYHTMELQQKEVRRLRHDMRNHLTALYGLEGSSKKEYVDKLLETPALSSVIRFCENNTANVVLSAKSEQAASAGIRMEIKAEIPDELPIAEIELCSLLGNCLDNAVDAVSRLPGEKRWISFEAHVQKGLFAVEVKNPYSFLQINRDGRLQTLKKDKKSHGYGITNMEEIVKRYGGNLEIETKNEEFKVFFYLPVHM